MSTEAKLLERFINKHTSQVVSYLENYQSSEFENFFGTIGADQAGTLIGMMDRYTVTNIIKSLDAAVSAKIIEHMSLTSAAILIRHLDQKLRKSILDQVSPSISSQILAMIEYPENTVAAITETELFTLFADLTVEQSIDKLKKNKLSVFSHLFVLDREQTLVGIVRTIDMLKAEKNQRIEAIMEKNPDYLQAEMRIEYVAEGQYWDKTHIPLPVVGKKNQFIGCVTNDMLTNIKRKKSSKDTQLNSAGRALGDLYRIGLASLLHSATTISTKSK